MVEQEPATNDVKSSNAIFISEKELSAVVIVLLVIALCCVIAATYIRWTKNRFRQIECVFVGTAVVVYLVYMIDWLIMFHPMYNVNRITLGELQIYPGFQQDLLLYLKLIFTSSLLSWTILWSIKLSLLFLYRRLMRGLPAELRWWWVAFAYCIITYIFSVVGTFVSCGGPVLLISDPANFCRRSGDDVTRNMNYYGAFVADVTTDLVIMALPIRLIWNLQMPLRKKLSIGIMFVVGGMCMLAAIIRLVSINVKTGSSNPNPQWLALWGSVEATTAIIIGCLPTFTLVNKKLSSQTPAYSYSNTQKALHGSHIRMEGTRLKSMQNDGEQAASTTAWKGDQDSLEELAPSTGIRVTTDYSVGNGSESAVDCPVLRHGQTIIHDDGKGNIRDVKDLV